MCVVQKTLRLLTSTPLFPSFSPLVFLMWFITVHSAGYIAPCSADRQCNWVMLQQFCQSNKTFALGLWTYIHKVTSREILSGYPRWQLSAQSTPRAHGECSAVKWRKASRGWDSFILIKLTIKLMWLQRCLLDGGWNAGRQGEERREEKQTGQWERLLSCKHNVLFPASVLWIEQYLSTCWQHPGRKAHFVELLQSTF